MDDGARGDSSSPLVGKGLLMVGGIAASMALGWTLVEEGPGEAFAEMVPVEPSRDLAPELPVPEVATEPAPKKRDKIVASPEVVLPAAVARAAAVVFSSGRQVGKGGHFDVRITESMRRALRTVDVELPSASSSAARREAVLVRGLGRLVESLGSLEAGVAALFAERGLVEDALDLAYGSDLPHPERFESFSRYLPPSARRAAEGATRRVMALSIGYDLQWPVPEVTRVSSGFGMRIHPVLGEAGWHAGTDLAVDEGTPVLAMADGLVVYSKSDAVNGRFVKLDHGYGLTSAYVHNSRLKVKSGEWVKKGQVVALSGATGRATGPHLHFQVELDDRAIDPESFRERKAPRAHRRSIEAEAIGEARIPH